jgi:hypothetical protein
MPFFKGLLLADLNYMLQTIWPESSAYWLLLSDLFFGFAGGFTSIIGASISLKLFSSLAKFS